MADADAATDAIAPHTVERRLCPGFRVVVTKGPDRGRSLVAERTAMTIGTDPACDLRLDCRAVSRFHCEIEIGDRGALLTDLDSTNGTRVDGVRVVTAFLHRGTELEVGRDFLRFENDDARVGPELFPGERFGALVGRSPAMRAALHENLQADLVQRQDQRISSRAPGVSSRHAEPLPPRGAGSETARATNRRRCIGSVCEGSQSQ